MKPDIVMENEQKIIILDTKYKLIDEKIKISQGDLYQMYAYGKIYQYNSKKEIELFLIYPKTKNFNKCERYFFNENLPNNLRLTITPFDLQNDELLARL